ncbi:MAG: hypothetical protein HY938_09000 [Nitrosomonadales bacterium]|nr:hypothetical protein [Nitrosomonadales bacterium]
MNMNILPQKIRVLFALSLSAILLACGGGGGGGGGGGNTLPVVTVPANFVVQATVPGGIAVTFTASATDATGSVLATTCTPASGSVFTVGAHTVTCSATNEIGTGSASFTVTVLDSALPVVTVPANIVVEAAAPGGNPVNFTASAIDSIGGSLTTTCTPASGTTFTVGAHTVTCSATNAVGTGNASFTVTVQDTTPPVVTVPPDIISATSIVNFTVTASDLVTVTPTVACTPPSGSTFTINTPTTVNCTATDAAGNSSAIASFKVKYVARGTANPMDIYILNNMVTNQWKLWTTGTDGGFAGTNVTASITGTTMSVTVAAANTLAPGQFVTGTGVAADTKITAFGTGAGGVGTYTVSSSQTVSSGAMTVGALLPRTRANFDGNGTGANGTWANDAAVAQPPMIGVGGAQGVWAYSSAAINPLTGDVIIQGGGHANSGDSSLYGLNLTAGPGVAWSLKVPSARYISALEPKPAWSYQKPSNSLVTTTATGTSGTNTITVALATGIANGMYVTASGGGIPAGTTGTISGTTVTLSNNLTATLSSAPVSFSKGYWATTNKDGVAMPIAVHTYSSNIFGGNSDVFYLSGQFGFDAASSTGMGAAFAYKPSMGPGSAGMTGPLFVAATTASPFNYATTAGYVQPSSTGNTIGTVCANSHDGNLYTYGSVNGQNKGLLLQIQNASTSPTFVYKGVSNMGGILGFHSNCVIFKDPVNGAGRMSYFMHDGSTNANYGIWDDIESTPPAHPTLGNYNSLTYANGFPIAPPASPGAANYLSFDYNTDLDVMAMTDGADIWEASFAPSSRVLSAWTKITATGDVPTTVADHTHLPRLAYLSFPYYSYVMCNFQQCSVLRRQ